MSSAIQTFDELADEWLQGASISEHTHRAYKSELQRISLWARSRGLSPAALTPELATEFARDISSDDPAKLHTLGISRPLLTSSLDQARRIVGAWLRWAAARASVPASLGASLEWPDVDRHSTSTRPIPLKRLSGALRRDHNGRRKKKSWTRERFVAYLAMWMCLSPTEIAELQREQIRIDGNVMAIFVRNGRSKEWSTAPAVVLDAWLAYDKARGSSASAVTDLRHPHAVSPITIARILRKIKISRTKKSDSEALTARGLKRSFVQHAIKCGWTSDDLQRHLRRQRVRGAAIPRENPAHWRRKLALLEAELT